jgi:regulator of protease activity HflC (stomatin/prohibitin superfamily)
MSFQDRYLKTIKGVDRFGGETTRTELNNFALVRDLALVLFALILLIGFWPIKVVPTGSRGVVTQLGAIKRIEPEGPVFLWPTQNLALFSIRSEAADIEKADGSTSDTQPVSVSLTVRYSITPDKVAEVFEKYSHDGNLSSYVQTAAQEVVKAVTARYTAPDLIAKRQLVSNDIVSGLRAKLALYGAQVINVDMRNFAFDPAYMKAINDKVTQEQLKLAAENKAKTVEAEQKSKVAVAEGEAAAARAKADGDAYAQLKIAQAQADALRIQNAALAQNKDVLELRRIEVDMERAKRWNGQLPQNVYAGAPVPFLNVK